MAAEKLLFAHYLRGIASLSVLIGHLAGVFWLRGAAASNLANTPLYSGSIPAIVFTLNSAPQFDYGVFGVGVFFLISGFVIPFSLRKYESGQFLIARFFRIVPPYLAGFSITIAALILSSVYYGKEFLYTWWAVLANAMFMRDLFWIPEIDGIVWTLEIELKYYLLCAIIILWIKRGDFRRILLLCLLFFLGLIVSTAVLPWITNVIPWTHIVFLLYVYQMDITMITFMFIGTMIYFYYSEKISLNYLACAIILLFAIFSAEWYISFIKDGAYIGILNFSLALLLFLTLFQFRNGFFPSSGQNISRLSRFFSLFPEFGILKKTGENLYQIKQFCLERLIKPGLTELADISYSLYIVHGVTNYVIMRILLDLHFDPVLVLIIGISDSLVLAYLLNRYIEIPSNEFGKKIASGLKKRGPS